MKAVYKKRVFFSEKVHLWKKMFRRFQINTVCEEARCPNISECFSVNHFTFLILGDACSRACKFCNVVKGNPGVYDKSEPERIARFLKSAGIRKGYVVITSVTRDDLPDGGAGIFERCVRAIKEEVGSEVKVELLTPDFKGNLDSLKRIVASGADVIGHNVETVRRLYPYVRPQGDYDIALNVLKYYSSNFEGPVKSALMVGLGETDEEVLETMKDLKECGCSVICIGQYFAPSRSAVEVKRYVSDKVFEKYKDYGKKINVKVIAGRFVRSSYRAGEWYGV